MPLLRDAKYYRKRADELRSAARSSASREDRCTAAPAIVCRVDFTNEAEAAAFAQAFGGRVVALQGARL
jgi:hypothetical protein